MDEFSQYKKLQEKYRCSQAEVAELKREVARLQALFNKATEFKTEPPRSSIVDRFVDWVRGKR